MKISACIIARNEEKLLPQCLKSIKWVDEIIVVDTGSTDKTVEIAESFGAKVYHHPWENDFSLHRNQSIGYSTGDWILILDCDEHFVSKINKKVFKKRLAKLDRAIGALVVHVTEKGENRLETSWIGLRFFRRSAGLQYKGIVHNKASFGGHCAGTDIMIDHYGYSLSPDAMKVKHERTEKLLKERLDENDEDFNALYYMTQLRVGQKRWDEALDFGDRFFACFPIEDPLDWHFYSVMYLYMSWIYSHKNDGEKAYAWAIKGLEMFPGDVDLTYVIANIGFMSKRDDILKEYGGKYFKLVAKYREAKNLDTDKFENPASSDNWVNRAVYTADIINEQRLRKMMEVA